MDSFPSKEEQLLMDPVEFWSSQKAPKRPSSSASQRPSVRSASKDRDDPLLTAPPARASAPERNESRQSRIAVVLKSPANLNRSSWSHVEGENGGDSRAATAAASSRQATPNFASRAKKETPVPLPKTLITASTSTTSATATSIRTPVPLPKPLSRTSTLAVGPAAAPVTVSTVARVAAPTPVPLPKQFMRTPAPATSIQNATTSTLTSLPAPGSSPVPAPGSQPSAGRGRPKGWKPGMSYAELRGPVSPKPVKERTGRPGRPSKPKPLLPPGNPKRRGRPPKAPSPLPWQVYRSLPTSFTAFLCEWSGCKAELHNLDTLRRHVSVVHCRKAPLVCCWGKCAQSSQSSAPRQFPNVPSLRAHMEKKHLIPFSWHTGDGPQNYGAPNQRLKDEEIPDYLKDDQGNQVTPSIRDQEVEDFATWKHNRQKLKDLLVQLNDNLPSEESDSPIDED
ncbi:hypothetical protein HDV62DRAFT_343423 [Trichoderma sp. SZMC 28011]